MSKISFCLTTPNPIAYYEYGMDERIRGQDDTEWTVKYGERERKRLEQQASLSQKSPTLSIRHFLREHGVVTFALTLALLGVVTIPNIGGWGNISLKAESASMQGRIQSKSYQVDDLGSAEVPIYIQISTGDLLSWPDPNMDNKSTLQIYQELGLKPQQHESLLGKNIIVVGKKDHLVTRVPIPTTSEAQEKYKKYRKEIILGKFKWDTSRNGYAIFSLLEEEKSSVQFFLLIDPYTYGSISQDQAPPSPNKYPVNKENEVGVFETAWMSLAKGGKDGRIEYDKGVSASSQELDRILQRLTASAFSGQQVKSQTDQ